MERHSPELVEVHSLSEGEQEGMLQFRLQLTRLLVHSPQPAPRSKSLGSCCC